MAKKGRSVEMSDYLAKELGEVEKNIKANKNISKGFKSLKKVLIYLQSI